MPRTPSARLNLMSPSLQSVTSFWLGFSDTFFVLSFLFYFVVPWFEPRTHSWVGHAGRGKHFPPELHWDASFFGDDVALCFHISELSIALHFVL